MLKHRHLRDFLAIANARSLRSAAAKLGLTQPAISRSLQELEEALGVPLVERRSRGVVLTAAGLRFLERARIADESLRRGYEEARQLQGDLQGSVAVTLSSAAVLGLLPYAYPRFRAAWPGVSLRFVEAPFRMIEPRVRTGEIDFYAGPRPLQARDVGFAVQPLCRQDRVVMARKGHPRANARHLSELLNEEWLVVGMRDRVEEELEEVFSAHGLVAPPVHTRVESMLALMTLLATTDALVLLPGVWASSPIMQANLQRIQIEETLAAPDIVLLHAASFPLTPAAEKLAVLLQRAAGKRFPDFPKGSEPALFTSSGRG